MLPANHPHLSQPYSKAQPLIQTRSRVTSTVRHGILAGFMFAALKLHVTSFFENISQILLSHTTGKLLLSRKIHEVVGSQSELRFGKYQRLKIEYQKYREEASHKNEC